MLLLFIDFFSVWVKQDLLAGQSKTIEQGNVITTLYAIGREYRMELEFYPKNESGGWRNIIQFNPYTMVCHVL